MSVPTPPPHSYPPLPYGTPVQKPEVPYRRAFLWTAAFSVVGVALSLLALVLVVLLFVGLIVLLFAGVSGAEFPDGWWHELVGPVLAGLGLLFLLGVALVLPPAAGLLWLFRRSEAIRRWAAPLQGLTVAATIYVGGGMLATALSTVSDLFRAW